MEGKGHLEGKEREGGSKPRGGRSRLFKSITIPMSTAWRLEYGVSHKSCMEGVLSHRVSPGLYS